MPHQSLTLRTATAADITAVDALLARAYPRLLKADYPPSLLVTAIPRIARAQPGLVTCGTYHVATDDEGRILAAGGWSIGSHTERPAPGTGQVRHVVTDDRLTRRGLGRALLTRVMDEARAHGMTRLDCLSTLTAAPFYRALGFTGDRRITVALGPGIDFPVIAMARAL